MGMTVEPQHFASLGINRKAWDALDPSRARNDRDRKMREALHRRIRDRLQPVTDATRSAVVPNLARCEQDRLRYAHGVAVRAEHFTELCRKLVKGVTWIVNGSYIDEKQYILECGPSRPDLVFDAWIASVANDFSMPPGLVVKRLGADDDPVCALFQITIWHQYQFMASCRPRVPAVGSNQ
jgi:hypothetical protein